MVFRNYLLTFSFLFFAIYFNANAQKALIDSICLDSYWKIHHLKIKQESCFGFIISKNKVNTVYADDIVIGEEIKNILEQRKGDLNENILFLTICGEFATFKKRNTVLIRNEFNSFIYV